jgi:hypothetical protein
LRAHQLAQKLESGTHRSSFWASGDHFGFDDILGCAQFLGTYVRRTSRHSERENVTSARTPVASGRKSLGSTASA